MISSKLSIEFNRIGLNVQEAYLSVGMITDNKYKFFLRTLKSARIISIVSGIHMSTPPSIFEDMKEKVERNEIQAKVFTRNFFHPKLYLFKLSDRWIAFVGSGNFTDGGWHGNEELFITINNDPDLCASLKRKHEAWFELAEPITDKFLANYQEWYNATRGHRDSIKRHTKQFTDRLSDNFNIDNVNFEGQYFSKEDHLAFAPGKTHLDTPSILSERKLVRNKLYDLNEQLQIAIPREWNIHPHYIFENIVANIETDHHHDGNVQGLWVGYGRSRYNLKEYGEIDTTPLNFMRLQVIVKYDTVGIWLMPGKSGAGRFDREHFLSAMQNENYKNRIFELLAHLGTAYWIDIAGEKRTISLFSTADDLKTFTDLDNWRYYYFTIGRDYKLGSRELLSGNFIQTVISDFSRLMPLYNLIKDNFNQGYNDL